MYGHLGKLVVEVHVGEQLSLGELVWLLMAPHVGEPPKLVLVLCNPVNRKLVKDILNLKKKLEVYLSSFNANKYIYIQRLYTKCTK